MSEIYQNITPEELGIAEAEVNKLKIKYGARQVIVAASTILLDAGIIASFQDSGNTDVPNSLKKDFSNIESAMKAGAIVVGLVGIAAEAKIEIEFENEAAEANLLQTAKSDSVPETLRNKISRLRKKPFSQEDLQKAIKFIKKMGEVYKRYR